MEQARQTKLKEGNGADARAAVKVNAAGSAAQDDKGLKG